MTLLRTRPHRHHTQRTHHHHRPKCAPARALRRQLEPVDERRVEVVQPVGERHAVPVLGADVDVRALVQDRLDVGAQGR